MIRVLNKYYAITAALLILVVVTQVIYFTLSSMEMEINRSLIWTTEAAAFIGMGLLALMALAAQARLAQDSEQASWQASAIWAAIGLSGIFNLVQVGMGLAMFGPLKDAGEAMAPAFQSVLAGAFFLYFAGKFLFGGAAILVGVMLGKRANIAGKIIGGLAVVSGLAALIINLGAMARGMELVIQAGASGTAATLMLALGLLMLRERAA